MEITAKYLLKNALAQANMKTGDLADLLGMDRQVFYNKVSRDKMSVKDLNIMLEKIGFELTIKRKFY